MQMFDLNATLLLTPFIFTLSLYGIIGIVSLYHSKRKIDRCKNKDYCPLISIVIPTFNEENIIRQKLENTVNCSYPNEKMEIIVVDSSTDKTPHIVREFSIKYPLIKLIHDEKRVGLATALNKAYKICKGEIIVKTDCDTLMDSNTLSEMVSNFADPTVGAVTGKTNVANNILQEKNYKCIQQIIQTAESRIDSIYMTHTLAAYRRRLIREYDATQYGDETIQSIHIRRQNYRAIYDQDVNFYEAYPDSTKERMRQKVRRAEGHVRILLENLDMFFNLKYKKFGLYVFPSNFFMIIVSPLLLCLSLAMFVLDLIYFSSMLVIDLVVLGSIGITYFGRHKTTFSSIWTFIELQYAQLLAMKNVLF